MESRHNEKETPRTPATREQLQNVIQKGIREGLADASLNSLAAQRLRAYRRKVKRGFRN